MTIIEIGLMGVKPNYNVMDPSTNEGQILKRAWDAVSVAPEGPHWVHAGLEINEPSKIWGFFAFGSVEQHENFARTFGGEAVKDLPKIMSHSEFQKHVQVSPFLELVLQAPVTEVVFTYFPSDISASEKSAITALTQQMISKGLGDCADAKAVSYGWGVENDFPVLGGEVGQSGAVLALFVGWTNVEARDKFQAACDPNKDFEKINGVKEVLKSVTRLIQCREFGKAEE